jgi:hypothetical protein
MNHNSEHEKAKEWIALKAGKLCPFVQNPFEECFVAGIDSQNIEKAIYYCGSHFDECEIYAREQGGAPEH